MLLKYVLEKTFKKIIIVLSRLHLLNKDIKLNLFYFIYTSKFFKFFHTNCNQKNNYRVVLGIIVITIVSKRKYAICSLLKLVD